jgi:hypothetical protein
VQELIEQIAIRRMELDAVETGASGVHGRDTETLDDAGISPVSNARGTVWGRSGRMRLTWPSGATRLLHLTSM